MKNVYQAGTGFKILHSTKRSQMASMILDPGESSSEKPNTHSESDQTLIVLDGALIAEISGNRSEMKKGDAVTVPAVAVFDDELDEDKHYVFKAGAGKPEKVTVTVGKRSGGRAEITAGLQAGDEILLAKP